jgi:hypothetical protein
MIEITIFSPVGVKTPKGKRLEEVQSPCGLLEEVQSPCELFIVLHFLIIVGSLLIIIIVVVVSRRMGGTCARSSQLSRSQ